MAQDIIDMTRQDMYGKEDFMEQIDNLTDALIDFGTMPRSDDAVSLKRLSDMLYFVRWIGRTVNFG